MSRKDHQITIAHMVEEDEPVAEIYYKNNQWAEINYEFPKKFDVLFFNKEGGNYWEFPYEEAMEILQEAKNRLAKLQRTPEQQAAYEERMKELENWKPTPEEQAEYEAKMEEQRKKYYE
jgi:hypothetical protein